MWRLFNNPNQVPITLSIFGVVLTFVQYFFLPSWIPRVPEVLLLGADFSVSAASTGSKWSNESKIENHLVNFSFSILNSQTVQPVSTYNRDVFLNNRRITWAPRVRATKGVWKHAIRENFEILMLWNAILVFWEGDFFLKCSLNWVLFLCLFLFACFHTQVLDFVLYFRRYIYVFRVSISIKRTLF